MKRHNKKRNGNIHTGARKTDPLTSHESAAKSLELSGRLRARIVQLAKAAGHDGITLSEAVLAIPQHKPSAITPRFNELVRCGQLVRIVIGARKPTNQFEAGRPIYMTRRDEQTNREVIVHWSPEFAPWPQSKKPNQSAPGVGDSSEPGIA